MKFVKHQKVLVKKKVPGINFPGGGQVTPLAPNWGRPWMNPSISKLYAYLRCACALIGCKWRLLTYLLTSGKIMPNLRFRDSPGASIAQATVHQEAQVPVASQPVEMLWSSTYHVKLIAPSHVLNLPFYDCIERSSAFRTLTYCCIQ